MQKPGMPKNEEERIKTLHGLKILDTSAEERFDRLTRLARKMFNVPIALVCLIDINRQWFKSCSGLDITETPRDISFCGHAIVDDKILIIEDTYKDARFSDNPMVLEPPFVRFYAGFPLKHVDGNNLGTLCIVDSKPRKFDKKDALLLKDLAELAEQELIAVQLALLDDLTNISNRRGFISLAEKSLQICAKNKAPLCLIFLDLNHLKSINDQFGHEEGDKALIAFAEIFKSSFQHSDVFARLGGDEFAVLLTGQQLPVNSQTSTLIEQANDSIKQLNESLVDYNKKANRGYEISFSRGIVNIENVKGHTITELLNQADALMYEDKKAYYQLKK